MYTIIHVSLEISISFTLRAWSIDYQHFIYGDGFHPNALSSLLNPIENGAPYTLVVFGAKGIREHLKHCRRRKLQHQLQCLRNACQKTIYASYVVFTHTQQLVLGMKIYRFLHLILSENVM